MENLFATARSSVAFADNKRTTKALSLVPRDMDHTDLRRSLDRFGGYAFLNTGYDEEHQITWAKMRYLRDEVGHRSLEFLAWVTTDMSRARDPISFYPTAAPPYLNEPGSVLSFVIQIYHEGMKENQYEDMIAFIDKCHDDYYESCKP